MAKKKDIIDALDELGVEYNSGSTKSELEVLLDEAKKVEPQEPIQGGADLLPSDEVPVPPVKPKDEKAKPTPVGLVRKVVTEAKLKQLQDDGLLVGYDPQTKEAILKG